MGNELVSSCESNMRKYGKWEKGEKCCDRKFKHKIKELRWKSCPLTNDIIANISVHYLSTGLTYSDISHDFIEAQIECENEECQNKKEKFFCYTIEYGSMGAVMNLGSYKKLYKNIETYIPKRKLYLNLEGQFDSSKLAFKASDYNFLTYNCKIYASTFLTMYKKMDENSGLTNIDNLAGEACLIY